jgi:hypothetical protein
MTCILFSLLFFQTDVTLKSPHHHDWQAPFLPSLAMHELMTIYRALQQRFIIDFALLGPCRLSLV